MKQIQTIIFLVLLWQMTACEENASEKSPRRTQLQSDSVTTSNLQDPASNPFSPVDISPMDMSYFPVDYPKLKMVGKAKETPVMRLIYSRPHLQRRHIFPDILKLDTPWRLGANEATEIDFFRNVTILGKKINAGRYTLYCIPHLEKWTLILNSQIDSWGLQQDTSLDIAKFSVPVTKDQLSIEYFTMIFEPVGSHAELLIAWDNVRCRLPIYY